MKTSRLSAIQQEKKIADQGGVSNRMWYINDEALESKGIGRFTPKKGSNFIAIVPPPDPGTYFGCRVHVHYNVGAAKDAFLCLQEMKRINCPICEMRAKIEAEEDFDQDFAKSLRPALRYLFYIVDMQSKESVEEGVKLMDAAFTIQQGIIGVSTNKRTGEIMDVSDPEDGKTVIFTRTGTGQFDTKYVDFGLEDRDPLPESWLRQVLDFEEILKFESYETVAHALGGSTDRSDDEKSPLQPSRATEGVTSSVRRRPPSLDTASSEAKDEIPFEKEKEANPVEESVIPSEPKSEGSADRMAELKARVAARIKKNGS